MKTYQKIGVNLEIKCSVEYVFDPRVIAKLEAETHPAPWELYEVKEFDNLDDAVSFFLPLYFNPKCYDPKLFIQILLGGEVIQESYLDINSTTTWTISNLIDHDRQKRLERQSETIQSQDAVISEYKKLTKAIPSFDRWRNQYLLENPNSALMGEG